MSIQYRTLPVLCLYIIAALYLKAGDEHPANAAAIRIGVDDEADSWWAKYGLLHKTEDPIDGLYSENEAANKYLATEKNASEYFKWSDRFRTRYREKGIEFWNRFPSDPRRFTWLLNTLYLSPKYWSDEKEGASMAAAKFVEKAAVDGAAIAKWNRKYLLLRAEFMNAPDVTEKQKGQLRIYELYSHIQIARLALLRNENVDMLSIATELLDVIAAFPQADGPFTASTLADNYLAAVELMPDYELYSAFLAAMRMSPVAELQKLAIAKGEIVKHRIVPLELKLPALKGGSIDLSTLKGKVVLVDFWANTCSSCIEAMPGIKRVYDRYRGDGFEVIGVWITPDVARDQPRALKILDTVGPNWPMGILAGETLTQFQEKYALFYVPVTWLIDQNGNLVTTDVTGPRLESEIRRLLGISVAGWIPAMSKPSGTGR